MPLVNVLTFRDDKVARIDSFVDRASALEAAGLRESVTLGENGEKLARRWAEAFNAFMRGELSSDAYAEQLDPQCEVRWHEQRTYPDAPQHLRGVPEIMAFMEQYRSTWDDLAVEPVEFIDVPGDQVLVFVRQSGRGRESGVPIVIHFFELLTIRDGKLRKFEFFRHRADALQAAALPE